MFRFLSYALILSLFTTNLAIADECPNAVFLKKGETVKDCDRVGLSKDYDEKVRKDLVEGDVNKDIIKQQKLTIDFDQESIEIQKKRADLFQKDAERERQNYLAERDASSRNIWIGLAAGILTTILIGLVVKPVVSN